ncbi:hypothetical protein QR680_004429 [Steinernema hermaphroditum]|uniref:Metalloendopeptidase n=1 Tax=Steinernema hermaphroditum TaxID=289476 RepID=A0AA39LT62_9BILA|nr:hypothetical protein QR680_004429 [Steinernema hermaphroditum]
MWLFASLLAIEVVLSVTSSDFNVSPLSRSRRQVMRDPSHRWSTSGPISYYFDGIEPAAQKKIREAFQFWEEHTCLRFRENGQGWPKIRLYPGGKCASDMGMQRGAGIQNMSLGDGCENFGTATHEIAHTLGFHHEHMRYDRDDYLDFDWNNIIASAKKGNFEKQTPLTSENYGVPYDYGSVMHYNAAAFYRDPNKDTIFAKDRLHQETMGQRIKPSFFDVLLMNAHYGCLGEMTVFAS